MSWHPDLAERVFEFFRCLELSDAERGGSRPFELEPSQKFIVGAIFGWLGSDGYRRFRTAYIEEAKGNGKTPLAAGVGLTGLVADGEPEAEVYSAAVGRDQAKICWTDADRFVSRSHGLRRRIIRHANNLAFPATDSFFRPVSSEGRGLDGKRVHIALVDEVHEHPTAIVVDKMRAGTKGRRQGLIFEITNSGYDRNTVCFEHHDYSVKVLEGTLENDSWFAFIAAVDEDDDPLHDESCWIKANPLLGVSVTEKYLREQVQEARDIPSKRNLVLRLNFCRWTESRERWIAAETWKNGAGAINEDELKGRICYGGLDLASTIDLAALGLVFRPVVEGERWQMLVRCFMPKERAEFHARKGNPHFTQWAREGWLQLTPGNVIDYEWIRDRVHKDAEAFRIEEIAFDRWNASQIVTQLQQDGFTMVQFGQGFASMSAPSKEFERLLAAGAACHGDNPLLGWMVSNAAKLQDPAGNIKPDKSRSGGQIDGVVALIMALARAVANEDHASVYDKRGVIAI